MLKGLDDTLSFDEETQPPSGMGSRDQEAERPAKKARHAEETEEDVEMKDVETEQAVTSAAGEDGEQGREPARAEEVAHALSVLATTLEESAGEWSPEDLVRISRYCERMNSRIVLALSHRLHPSP